MTKPLATLVVGTECADVSDLFDAYVTGFAERDEFNKFIAREIAACRLTHPPAHVLALMERAWLERAYKARQPVSAELAAWNRSAFDSATDSDTKTPKPDDATAHDENKDAKATGANP